MGLSDDKTKALIALLLGDDDGGKDDKAAEEAAKKAAEEAEAKRKAEAESKAEEERKAKEAEEAKAEEERKKAEEAKNNDNSANEELEKLKVKAIKSDIKEGLNKNDLESENFDIISDFFAYDKLRGEDGEADSEKVDELVRALTGIALRTPPGGGADPSSYDPANQGIGKYLK